MINNFARRHARPLVWRILAGLALALVIGIMAACIVVVIVWPLYLAMTVTAPVR